jgi:hypothetical protein
MSKLLPCRSVLRSVSRWLRPDPIQSELVGLAAEVAAATSSARALLAGAPEGPARRRLLQECDALWQIAGEVLDPRYQLEQFAESQLEELFEIFMQYQEQAVRLRADVYRLAGVRELSRSVVRVRT